MILALIGITLAYLFIIGRFVLGFDKDEDFKMKGVQSKTSFSIIVPFRNEAKNLPNLLESLSELHYPKELFEVILIDDDSEDESINIVEDVLDTQSRELDTLTDIRIIKNERTSESPKKDAITTAVKKAKFDWLITTDADCTFNSNWLTIIDAFIQVKQPKMIVGPVKYHKNTSFLGSFQSLDFMSLIGATIGSFGIGKPFLCNGANLAYSKTMFYDVNGFKGNNDIASGDDIFLMEKFIKKYPEDVLYLKHTNAIVSTKPQNSLSGLISQRKRWAAKTSSYSNSYGKLVGAVVLLMNFSLLAGTFLALFGVYSFKMIGYVFLIKFSIDLLLIFKCAQFFKQTKHLKSYLISSLFYPFFNVYVAISSWYSGYVWKGRVFKK